MWGYSLTLLSLVLAANAASWGYIPGVDGPDTWPDPLCQTGTKQSPIDIPYNITYVDDWLPFQFLHYQNKPRKMFVTNNGHTAKVTLEPEGCDDNVPKIVQGNLPATYELAQIHFHWGSKHHKGSEHRIHGHQSEAELHFVHYKTECGRTLAEALENCGNDATALAVLGVMIEEGHEKNHAFEPILDALHHIETAGAVAHFSPVSLMDLLPNDVNEFWRYQGSLTTPGVIGGNDCAEIVIWTVFKNKVTLSKHQIEKFFDLKTESGGDLENNYRPPQPLNGREVFFANLELDCPDHDENDWKKSHRCNIGHRETKYEHDFNSAVHACIGYHYGNSMSQGLIPVGRLRCMRNRFGPAMNNKDHFCNRYYRVNGMKDEHGLWREYPSGRRISFHHFPEFKELHGGEGDTLIFDALENRLYIDDRNDHYHALCYRDYQKDCEQCAGFETGHECSDAGDCMSNQCQCDAGFSGLACQNAPIPPKDLVQIGYDSLGSKETGSETFDTISHELCNITSYEDFTGAKDGMMCDFVFGKGICCGGAIDSTTNMYTDMCGIYDCFKNGWEQFHDLPKKLTNASATVVRGENGRDIGWLVSGGQENNDGTDSNMLYWLDEHLRWTCLDTAMPTPKSLHCSIQINDCEIAIIGGDNTATIAIDIYNYKENTWRSGPELGVDDDEYQVACGKIIDKSNYHTYVVIGNLESDGTIRLWDVQTNAVVIDDEAKDTHKCERYHSLDENTLIMANCELNEVQTYRVDEGLQELQGSKAYGHSTGDSFLAPRKTTTCWDNL